MYSTLDAIILSLQPHTDKAHVLHAYTRTGGHVHYNVYGLGRKNAAGTYAPLSIVQLTTDERSVRTAQLAYIPRTLNSDPYKRTIVIFISEVLYHVLRHPMTDEPMYDFIAQSIQELDQTDAPQNFHLSFLVGFAEKLGFAIPGTSSRQTGGVASAEKGHLPLTRKARQEALRTLCAYFAEHVETWQNPKSLDILMEVFD